MKFPAREFLSVAYGAALMGILGGAAVFGLGAFCGAVRSLFLLGWGLFS